MIRRTHRGFTLIELLIVIVIVGILAAAAVGLFLSSKKDAYATEAKGVAGQIKAALETSYQKNSGLTNMPGTVANLATYGYITAAAALNGSYYQSTDYTWTSAAAQFDAVGRYIGTVTVAARSPAPAVVVTYNSGSKPTVTIDGVAEP